MKPQLIRCLNIMLIAIFALASGRQLSAAGQSQKTDGPVMGVDGNPLSNLVAQIGTQGELFLPLIMNNPRPGFLPTGEHCECVLYAVRYLFDKDSLPGSWDYAKNMASDLYWGRYDANYKFRTPYPEPGDAIIFQPNAVFEVMLTKGYAAGTWLKTTVGNSYGHIGIVTSASYLYPAGWELEIRSANWEETNWTYPVPTEEGCNNVGTSSIKVAFQETGISFWRGGPFIIRNPNSGKCLDVPGWTINDAPLNLYSCTFQDNQIWGIRGDGADTFDYTIQNSYSAKCMDVSGESTQAGTPILQYGCHYGDNQDWIFNPVYPASYNIISKSSGLCLDVEGSSTEDGAAIIQNTCDGRESQKWMLK